MKYKVALDLTLDSHPHKSSYLNNLGNSLKTRFVCLREQSDLEQAILRQKDAVDIIPHGHPHKYCYLNNLGNSLKARFDRLGELSDIEEAILR